MREKIWTQNEFDDKARKVFAAAEMLAEKQECEELRCSHVFAGCIITEPGLVRTLLGRDITRLPESFELPDDAERSNPVEVNGKGREFSPELSDLFLEDSHGDPLGFIRSYLPGHHIGVPEILFILLSEPTEEISDILLENGFPNDAALLESILRENYLNNILDFCPGTPKERLAAAGAAGEEFEKLMSESLFGQKKAVADVSSVLTEFWHCGKNGKPLVLLLLSKAGGGRSFFADCMQRAFVRIGLQSKVQPPLDLSGFVNDSSCDVDLLGDARSFRNARCGKLYNMAKADRHGMMVFEDIHGGSRTAKNILHAFASNLAYDKFNEETLLLPFNVLVFTMAITDDQYNFLKKKNSGNIDAKLLNKLFWPSDSNKNHNVPDSSALDSCALWQCADKIVLLDQLTESELAAMIKDQIVRMEQRLKTDYGIEFLCDDTKGFIRLLVESEPHEFGPGELAAHFNKTMDGLWQTIGKNPTLNQVRISCASIPEYRYDPARRIIRGDYLVHRRREEISSDRLELIFDEIRYTQQERVDCGDYRIERPKGIVFDDIVGLDEVRDELLDSLYYITNRDRCKRKIPDPSLGFILYGPPGTGKTSIAIALANSADIPVFFASSSIFSDARNLNAMFQKAADMAPAIVVLDEFNSIGDSGNPWKRDVINELLAILDGFKEKSNLLVIASTNHIEHIEEAFFRPGRFGRQIMVGLPNADARNCYVRKFEKEFEFSLSDEVRDSFVQNTDHVSLAEIKGVLGYALRRSLRTSRSLDAETLNEALFKLKKNNRKNGIGFTIQVGK